MGFTFWNEWQKILTFFMILHFFLDVPVYHIPIEHNNIYNYIIYVNTHIERVFLIWSHSCSTLTSVPAWPETSHTDSSDCCPHCCSDASKLWKNENHILSHSKLILQSPTLIDPNDIVLTQKGLFRFKCIFEPLRLQRVLYHLTGQRKNGVTSL